MGAVLNGIALHGGVRAYGATFLVFYDYMRPPIRLAALSGTPAIFVFTHDSIGLGEDGPTHQPVEQLAGMRTVSNLLCLRPCDANETAEAWRAALQNRRGPSCLLLTRQDVPVLDRAKHAAASGLHNGAYVLCDAPGAKAQILLIASGSEVHIALQAQTLLAAQGVGARVVSMPSWDLFARQPQSYRDEVLPPAITARISIEAGVTFGWERWVGSTGIAMGIDHFGASAPYQTLYEKFGLTPERVVENAKQLLGGIGRA
jgi:transketolase